MTECPEPAQLFTPGACCECGAVHVANAIALYKTHRRYERPKAKIDFNPLAMNYTW
jgi:hypothetical protein